MSRSLTSLPLSAARWSATHPWRAILLWALFVTGSVALAVVVPTRETQDSDYRLGQSGQAEAWVQAAGLTSPDTETVLLTGRGGALDRGAAQAAGDDVRRRAAGVSGVAATSPVQWSPDGSAGAVTVTLARGTDDVGALQAATAAVQRAHSQVVVRQAGDISVNAAIDQRVGDDLSSAETTSLPVTLVLMLAAFGALVAAGLPVLLAVTSVAAAVGLMGPISRLVPAEPTVTSMIVLIGMAVGVDYSLFYLRREREERRSGRTPAEAVEIAARTSGHSILVSGGAVLSALAGLYLVGSVTFDSLATGGIVVVAVAVLGSITVLPALLVKLGRWMDRPRVPVLWRLTRARRAGRRPISARMLGPVLRHPTAALLLATVATVALAVPALGLRTGESDLSTLPASIPQVQTLRTLEHAFPDDEGLHATVVVRAPAAEVGAVGTALRTLGQRADRTGALSYDGAAPQVSADRTTSVLTLGIPYAAGDARASASIDRLRDRLAPGALGRPGGPSGSARTAGLDGTVGLDGVHWAVGGETAAALDTERPLQQRLPLVVGFVVLLTLIVMGVSFRSVPVALVSALLNLASVGVALGVITLVFQHGWLSGWLGFTSPGFVIDWLPLFVLVVLVGLSMDYHVFVVSRIRELVGLGLTPREAVARGIEETAGVVTSAAVVMMSVFALFATLSLIEMKTIGVGLCFAILFDATVVRLVILPAALSLLGDRAWGRRAQGSAAGGASVPVGEVAAEVASVPAYEPV